MRRLLLLTKYAALSVSAPKPHVCGAHRDVRHEDTSEIVVDVVDVGVVVVAVMEPSLTPSTTREYPSWPSGLERAPFLAFLLLLLFLLLL